ncbi:hypothetical protein QQP08_015418 [Theobroma cacao]|nr:hypothetical protein QQP08_015418 [Theobroma cacao]
MTKIWIHIAYTQIWEPKNLSRLQPDQGRPGELKAELSSKFCYFHRTELTLFDVLLKKGPLKLPTTNLKLSLRSDLRPLRRGRERIGWGSSPSDSLKISHEFNCSSLASECTSRSEERILGPSYSLIPPKVQCRACCQASSDQLQANIKGEYKEHLMDRKHGKVGSARRAKSYGACFVEEELALTNLSEHVSRVMNSSSMRRRWG